MFRRIVLVLVLIVLVNPISFAANHVVHAQRSDCVSRLQVGDSGKVASMDPGAEVHSKPDESTNVIGYIPNGTVVAVQEKQCVPNPPPFSDEPPKSWLLVSYNGITGWILEFNDPVWVVNPNEQNQQSTSNACKDCVPITYGQTVTRTYNFQWGDWFSFQGKKGDVISISFQAKGAWNGPLGDMGPFMQLLGPGNFLVDADFDFQSRSMKLSGVTLPADGEYVISIQLNYEGSYELSLANASAPSCPIHSISVDSSLSEGVLEGKVLGENPCDATIEIHNTRSYWVNLKVIPLGGSKAVAAGGDANIYAKFGILGPDASVHYSVSFPKVGRSIQVQVDATLGAPAKIMNFTQFVVDAISLRAPGVGSSFTLLSDYYPTLADTYASTPNIRDAMNAFFDNDFVRFNKDMEKAASHGEFVILGSTLKKLGVAGVDEGIGKLLQRVGRALGIVDIIWRNADNVSAFLSGKSTFGSVLFVAR